MSPELQKKIQSYDATVLSAIFHNANILHSYNVEHTYFFGNKTSLNQPTAEKNNRVLFALMFVQIETLNHAPTTPTDTQTSSYFDGKK